MIQNDRTTDTILVSFDRDPKDIDTAVLVIGRKVNGRLYIINAFQGKKAELIYLNLITKETKDGRSEEV